MSWHFCWAFVSTRSHCSFLKHCHILGIFPFVIAGNCQCDKVHYSICKKHWLIRVQWVFKELYVLFWSLIFSLSALVMITSWPSVALQKIVIPISFQHNPCVQYHLSELKCHQLLNKSASCQTVKLTTCEAVMLLYLLYLARDKGKLTFWENSICCRAEFLPAAYAHRWWGSRLARDRQQQAGWPAPAPAKPCVLSQAAGSNWCLRDWWGKNTTERWCLC